jgi:hypothetical protein
MTTHAGLRLFGAVLVVLAALSEARAQETKPRVYENRLTPLNGNPPPSDTPPSRPPPPS